MAADPTQQRGTGLPVSADQADEPAGSPAPTQDEEVDPAVVTGATAGWQPALGDEVTPNRSGSSGPTDPDAPLAEDGSGGRSMDEMLGSDSGESGPRH